MSLLVHEWNGSAENTLLVFLHRKNLILRKVMCCNKTGTHGATGIKGPIRRWDGWTATTGGSEREQQVVLSEVQKHQKNAGRKDP